MWRFWPRSDRLTGMAQIQTSSDVAAAAGISEQRLRDLVDREMDIITVDEAAEWLGVSARRLRAVCARGEMPAAKIGREWRISRRQVLDYIERRKG